MKKHKIILTGIVLLVVVFLGVLGTAFFLGPVERETTSGKLSVVVSIEPQAYFIRQIAGDRVRVEVLVPAGKEPETYTPSPEKIRKLAKSTVFFRVGFPPEDNFLPRLKSVAPKLQIIDTRQGLSLRDASPHDHGHSHDHDAHSDHVDGTTCSSDGTDPHVWMSPAMVKQQAKVILDVLVACDPDGESAYRDGYEKFMAELTDLQTHIREKLEPLRGKTIYVYHPSYGYFCDEFGLVQKAIEIEGKSPTPKGLADWIRTVKQDEIAAIIVQPEFNRSATQTVAKETGVPLVSHSPLESDYHNCLLRLTEMICTMYYEF